MSFSGDLPAWAERAARAVVLVEADARRETRAGSGFFLDRQGLVATALHTVEGARRIRVSVPGAYATSDGRLIAASSTWDLAVISVPWPAETPYAGLPLDDGPKLTAGTEVALTGYAQIEGVDARTLLTAGGIVSGRVDHRGGYSYLLDIATRPGLSGSPVYRADNGEVIAILTRLLAPQAGVGLGGAAPAHALLELVDTVEHVDYKLK